jgi:hypothetical protein
VCSDAARVHAHAAHSRALARPYAGGFPPDTWVDAVRGQVLTAKKGEGKAAGKSKGSQAKELLKRYGSAYLITSISLSLISFGLCYLLVYNGVDVAALLQQIGMDSTSTSEKVRLARVRRLGSPVCPNPSSGAWLVAHASSWAVAPHARLAFAVVARVTQVNQLSCSSPAGCWLTDGG